LAGIVQRSLQEVRRISRDLRPEALDELGLVSAFIAPCSRVAEQSGIRVYRRLQDPVPELAADVELAIYRVAQEALTNATRRSKPWRCLCHSPERRMRCARRHGQWQRVSAEGALDLHSVDLLGARSSPWACAE
jgi:hypothetical protein